MTRPILFSAPMIRALLDGRKTVTRRIVKPQPEANFMGDPIRAMHILENGRWAAFDDLGIANGGVEWRCPYGQVGDELWVKETWGTRYDFDRLKPTLLSGLNETKHRAEIYRAADYDGIKPELVEKWRPSIFMPRWASRITLRLTAVSVERLQDISEEDAVAEGCDADSWAYPVSPTPGKSAYRTLWESINGPGSWAKNPFCWVLKFERVDTTKSRSFAEDVRKLGRGDKQ